MGFLKRIGTILGKATQIAVGIQPYMRFAPADVQKVEAAIVSELEQVAGVVTSIEAVGQVLNIAGPEKLKAAAPLVAQVVLQSSMLANHKIADEALFRQGCTKLGDGMADILNSLDADGAMAHDKTKA